MARGRWIGRVRSEFDVGLTHLFIAVTALIALLGAATALGIALYNDPGTAIATAASAAGGKTIDSPHNQERAGSHSIRTSHPQPEQRSTRSRSTPARFSARSRPA